jgi:hypothetical protein
VDVVAVDAGFGALLERPLDCDGCDPCDEQLIA